MPLSKQRVSLPLSKGINQKIDPKQGAPGTLEELENIQVSKYGEVEKREGYELESDGWGYSALNQKFNYNQINGITSLNDELLVLTPTYAAGQRADIGRTIYMGKYLPASAKTLLINQDNWVQTNNSSVVVNDRLYSVHMKRRSTAITSRTSNQHGIYFSVRDLKTEAFWIFDTLIFNNSYYTKPQIHYLQGKIVFLAVNDSTNNLSYRIADPDNYDELTDDGVGTSFLIIHSDQIYDANTNASNELMAIGYKRNSDSTPVFASFAIVNNAGTGTGLTLESCNFMYSTGTEVCLAVDVQPIMATPKKQGVRTESLAEGGFLCNALAQYSTAATYRVQTLVMDKLFETALMDTNYTTPRGVGTTTSDYSPKVPVAVTGVAVDNNVRNSTRDSIRYQVFVQSNLDGTASTGSVTGLIPYIDNKTGTYAAASLDTTDFGSTGYVKSGADGTAFTAVALADLPSCYKTRIDHMDVSQLPAYTGSPYLANYGSEIMGCTFFAKPFTVEGDCVLPVARKGGAGLQDTYYLTSPANYQSTTLGQPIGMIGYGVSEVDFDYSSADFGYPSVPRIAQYENKIIIPTLRKTKIKSNDNSFFTIATAANTFLEVKSDIANQNEEVSNNLHVAGCTLFMGDSARFIEHGFMYNPDRLYLFTENMGAGTAFEHGSTKTYNYVALYKYEDNQGNIHRSGLSQQLSFQLPAQGTGTNNWANVDLLIPMQGLTSKYKFGLEIEVYRTEVNGTLFYKVSDQDSTLTEPRLTNDRDDVFILFRDTVTDANLIDNELLYTTGGVLENTPIGSCSILESYKNRVFMAGVENSPDLLYYSKIVSGSQAPVEFNDTLNIEVPRAGGDVVALKKMDDKLIIFKKHAIYLLTGEGPNNLGEQNDFIEPQLVSSDLGCKFENSVVFMPKGLMFMSQKGIYLLTRSLQLEYIGAPAEDYNNLTITKATAVSKKDEVRFLCSDGSTIIYNYFLEMWYTYGNHRGNSSHIIGDDYYMASFKNKVYKQTSTTASFDGATVPIKLTTGWLSFAGVQGYQRIYRMLILGKYKSPHKLQIKVAYNYDDVWQEEKLIDVTGYTESYTYGAPTVGTQNTYGDPSTADATGFTAITYGGKDNTQYQIRLNFAKQKCEAIKIQILEVEGSNPAGNQESAGPGFNLSNLSFMVGVKDGDFKIKQSRVFGSTSIT